MVKKKILVIAPQSYPVTGAEAIVNTKMLQAMARSGAFEIDLISKKNKWQNYESDPIEDLGLGLNSLHIIEVDNKINVKSFFQHFLSLLYFGVLFKGCHWAIAALPVVRRLLKSNKYDYVLTKNAPSLLLGNYVKKHYGIKWVATWNDPYPENKYPAPYGDGWDSKESLQVRTLIRIMKNADTHIFPSERIRNYMLRYLKINEDLTMVLPHVILSNSEERKSQQRNEGVLRIIHSGNLKRPRNPKTFLLALSRLSKEYPKLSLKVTFQGVYDDSLRLLAEDLDLIDLVDFKGSVSYSESITMLKDYDVALIIEANCEEGIFLPTKVSDFLQCGKIIFAVSPQKGVLNDLFLNSYIPYFATVSEPDEIYLELKRLYLDFLSNKLVDPNKMIPRVFSEDYMVDKYLSL